MRLTGGNTCGNLGSGNTPERRPPCPPCQATVSRSAAVADGCWTLRSMRITSPRNVATTVGTRNVETVIGRGRGSMLGSVLRDSRRNDAVSHALVHCQMDIRSRSASLVGNEITGGIASRLQDTRGRASACARSVSRMVFAVRVVPSLISRESADVRNIVRRKSSAASDAARRGSATIADAHIQERSWLVQNAPRNKDSGHARTCYASAA